MRYYTLWFTFILIMLICTYAFISCMPRAQEDSPVEDLDQQERQLVMEDRWPEGCNSCHKVEGKDRTIATYTNQRVAGHPVVDSRDIEDCYDCHRTGDDRFARSLHLSHMNSRVYTEAFGAGCIGCHQMNDQGKVFIKGLED